jgi:hypothetical protein
MKYQRFISLSAMLSFIVLFISSGVLYFIPNRKVTSWTDWTFLYLDKQQWDNLHINLGILFLILIFWHIYYNWKPIKNYLKVKRELKIFTKEFNASLILVLLFCVGTAKMVIPFSFLVNIGNGIKAKNSLNDGNPPFGYAEYATLEDFCILTSINLKNAQDRLAKKGIKYNSVMQTLKSIAKTNNISPKDIYLTIKSKTTKFDLPSDIPIGIAHKTLKRLSNEYNMNLDKFITKLKRYNIKATPDITFKKLAKQNKLHPAQLYNMLLASQKM